MHFLYGLLVCTAFGGALWGMWGVIMLIGAMTPIGKHRKRSRGQDEGSCGPHMSTHESDPSR